MIDIVSATDGLDIGLYDTQTEKAANILSVQLGALEYAQNLGIDLRYFLEEGFRIQNESFQSYIVQVLANNGINVASVIPTIQALAETYFINLSPEETSSGFVAR